MTGPSDKDGAKENDRDFSFAGRLVFIGLAALFTTSAYVTGSDNMATIAVVLFGIVVFAPRKFYAFFGKLFALLDLLSLFN